MRSLLWTRFLAIAGAVVMALVVRAGLPDTTLLIDKAANNRTLTVRYNGGAIALVELRLNGVSIATRSVSEKDTSGETNFAIDPASLKDGENTVEVRVFDGAGKLVATEKSSLSVSREANGPVFLVKPKQGSTVQGPVELALGFKHQMRNVYVSFFVNDEFKSLKNFPPYTYLWDTSKEPNGWHEVQAWVVDDMNSTFKTERLRVFVNNSRSKSYDKANPARHYRQPD